MTELNPDMVPGVRTLTYFVSDVHMGLQAFDPEAREKRFVNFLRSIPSGRTRALYLLGDIWDFWYEWKHVVPKGYIRVFSALEDLMAAGVTVYFFRGNHDIWTYHYFEDMGMVPLDQPYFTTIGGKEFCLGHGDALGGMKFGYRILHGLFTNRFIQWCFSNFLHPDWSMALGKAWSRSNRLSRKTEYEWRGSEEPIYKYAAELSQRRRLDVLIFGHLHVSARERLASGAELVILDAWMRHDDWYVFDEASGKLIHNSEAENPAN